MRAAAVALCVAAVTVAGAGAAPTPASLERCPSGLLPLTRNAIAPASVAALRTVPRREDPQVTGARFAVYDQERGPIARHECGAAVWRRTVVVYITRRAYLPAVSASSGVYFVARFRSGYRVWSVDH
jgi:hypothetical protein